MKTLLFILLFILNFSFNASAVKITATGGNWNAPGTWNLGRVPACGDTIIIPAGITVHIAANVSLDAGGCAPVTLQVAGRLTFANGRKLRLSAGGCVQISVSGRIDPSGVGGGSSELIEIGGADWWKAVDGTLLGSSGGPGGVNLGCGVILPIELVDFSYENINETINILWSTASERDNDYFQLESSRDGSYWQEVAIIKGAGNSSEKLDYKIVDKSPFNGESYYRLTQYDINGVANRLGTQSIEFFPTKYLIYPVPVNKSMFLEGDNLMNSEIFVINAVGEIIDVEQTVVGDKISFNFSEVQNGAYFLTIENNKTKKTERISVVHK